MDTRAALADILDAHRDRLEAARVADLCAAAAGERLLEIRTALGTGRWVAWLNRESPLPRHVVASYIEAAQRERDRVRES